MKLLAILLVCIPSLVQAAPIVLPEDTIRATVPACFAGDPLCAPEFICRDDGSGRTCETLAGWIERQTVARRNTVGPEGWR